MENKKQMVYSFFNTLLKFLFSIVILTNCTFSSDEGVNYLKGMSKAFSSIATKTSPAVVFIETETNQQISNQWQLFSPFGDEIFKHFFKDSPWQNPPNNSPRTHKVLGQGSGFIFSKDGYILTNNHVVGNVDKVVVELLDGRSFVAKVIGTDKHSDIAVLKIKANNLTTLPLGDSEKLEVGEWVIALGNPFGLSHSLTSGVVSAKGRSSVGIASYENFIQTDAAINLGNSGGPLINLDGEAIGINTAIYSRTGGSMGIGFAIPINMVKSIKDQLIKKGTVTRGYLGIVIQNMTKELAKQFSVKEGTGILIADINQESPAERADLKVGDIILKFDGKEVNDVSLFRNQVAFTPPGKRVPLVIVRDGKEKTKKVKIGKLSENGNFYKSDKIEESNFGFSVDNITPEIRQRFGISPEEKGVIISRIDPSSVAAIAGMRPGMIIREVNKKKVSSIYDFKKAIKQFNDKTTVLLLIKDRELTRYITLSVK